MQINAINPQNFNGVTIPPAIRQNLSQDVTKLLKFDHMKMSEIAQIIDKAERKNNIDLQVVAKEGIFNPSKAADYDVFVIDRDANTKINIEGKSLPERFLAGIKAIKERV